MSHVRARTTITDDAPCCSAGRAFRAQVRPAQTGIFSAQTGARSPVRRVKSRAWHCCLLAHLMTECVNDTKRGGRNFVLRSLTKTVSQFKRTHAPMRAHAPQSAVARSRPRTTRCSPTQRQRVSPCAAATGARPSDSPSARCQRAARAIACQQPDRAPRTSARSAYLYTVFHAASLSVVQIQLVRGWQATH